MNLRLQREPSKKGATYGKLYLGDVFLCHTLEDTIREVPNEPVEKWKIQGATAIPAGTYTIVIDFSSRFRCLMPHLLGVSGFDGVRLHCGNTAAQTEGCVLVGSERVSVGNFVDPVEALSLSRTAFEPLFARMKQAAAANEEIKIEILNPEAIYGDSAA